MRLLINGYVFCLCCVIISIYLVRHVELYAQEDLQAETKLQEKAVKVFLDVTRRFEEYMKTEIPFVNYVRDRKQAQVYIMLTQQRTGAGGNEYTMKLIGQQNFDTINDTVTYVSTQSETDEVTRRGIVRILKLGLIRYVEKTPLADYLDVSYRRVTNPIDVVDKWDYWVFNVNLDTDLEGEESKREFSVDVSFSADRVTPASKLRLRVSSDNRTSKYELDEDEGEGEGWYTSIRRSKDFRGLYVKSLNNHWSAGAYANANTSTYSNKEFSYDIAPAIEYNVFPYSDYVRREFRFLYKAVYNSVNYEEKTIYGKMSENLFYESLAATFELKERWGSLSSTLQGSHYFHDLEKNRLRLSCNINLRLFEGFSFDIRGNVSMIRDQLSLPMEEATQEDILLRQREIATNYDYNISFGFRYTFGSIYSNVVNPRFGSGRRGGGRGRGWGRY